MCYIVNDFVCAHGENSKSKNGQLSCMRPFLMLRATSDCARQAPKVADHHPSKCFGFGIYNAPWHLPSIACMNHMSYSSGKMRSSSKPFDIYKGPNSNLEIIKPRATKANLLLIRICIKTKAHSKRSPL